MAGPPVNVFLDLTREFNRGRLRAVLSSGQAAVLHRLAVMSKDGDWILREDDEAVGRVLEVLAARGARYRLGAPLDPKWLSGGWSAHLEFRHGRLRVRTDFFSRPPRIPAAELARLWREQEGRDLPFTGARDLALMKMTNREKDYAVIGELARRMPDPSDQLLFSRSARDLVRLVREHRALAQRLSARRALLAGVEGDVGSVERALDEERRALIHENERRLEAFATAAAGWARAWPAVEKEIASMDLREAHRVVTGRAEGLLPDRVEGGLPDG